MEGSRGARALLEAYLERHRRCDLAGVLALFGADAVLEDPVGSPVHRGASALRAFFEATHRRNGELRIERAGPVIECGSEAACHVRAAAAATDFEWTLDVYYTLRADAAGESIAELRAFFTLD